MGQCTVSKVSDVYVVKDGGDEVMIVDKNGDGKIDAGEISFKGSKDKTFSDHKLSEAVDFLRRVGGVRNPLGQSIQDLFGKCRRA